MLQYYNCSGGYDLTLSIDVAFSHLRDIEVVVRCRFVLLLRLLLPRSVLGFIGWLLSSCNFCLNSEMKFKRMVVAIIMLLRWSVRRTFRFICWVLKLENGGYSQYKCITDISMVSASSNWKTFFQIIETGIFHWLT